MTPLPQWAHFVTLLLSLAIYGLGLLQGHGVSAGWVAIGVAMLGKLDAALPQLIPVIEWLRGKRPLPDVPPSEAVTPPPVTVDSSKSK